MIEGGYIVTNAHVVWPFDQARVVFPDGSEFLDAPLLNWDLLADIAILGPIETDISPVALVEREDLDVGSDLYLIGYPGELATFPQPTITRGILSRLRRWEAVEMTYFQTDAAIAGGQSGGVLVSEDGEVIGISGLRFTEAGFGLVASAADLLPRVEKLIDGEDVAGLGDRRIPSEGGQREHTFHLRNLWDAHMYVVDESVGTFLDIQLTGENDGAISLTDVFGNLLIDADDTLSGVEAGSATTELGAPYFVVLEQYSEGPGDFEVSSNQNFVPYHDTDDGAVISIGQTLLASVDYPSDADYFVLDLAEGDTVDITLDSVNFNPFLLVYFPGATEEQVLVDDDSGVGLLGENSKLTYQAPHTGSYLIVVLDSNATDVGGYILTVAEAPPGAAAVSPPAVPTPAATIESPFGPMAVYESDQYPFSIQFPADWIEDPADPGSFLGPSDEVFFAVEQDLIADGLDTMSVEEFTDFVLSAFGVAFDDSVVESREQVVIAEGLTAEVVHASAFAGVLARIHRRTPMDGVRAAEGGG